MAFLFVHEKCQHYYESGQPRGRRRRSELVFPVRRLAADGLEAWTQVVERG
jgi:hypothetical protein